MSKYLFGFIGTGNMGSALASAARQKIEGSDIILADADTNKALELAKRLKCNTGSTQSVVTDSKFIFLGVKPQMLPDLVNEIAPLLRKREDKYIIISMVAGTGISSITGMFGFDCPVIRIMPNITASVGCGMILYCSNSLVNSDDKAEFVDNMSFSGRFDELQESLIDAGCAVSGGGPAFVYLFIEAMADAGVECGLPREKAIEYAAQTVFGAGKLVLESGRHPGELKDAVCSPGGTTIAGVHALEDRAFRASVINAVTASFKRAKELG